MLQTVKRALGFDPNAKALKRYRSRVERINALEETVAGLSDAELAARGPAFKERLADGESVDELLDEVFAAVREVAKRTVGMRHFDVQLIGGMALHEGRIAEMKTGEGKTLAATLAVVLNGLAGEGVHLVTVNDYLAKRDARWMGPIYRFLGLSVGFLEPFMAPEQRQEAYGADITYGTNSEFGFDYLRDNMAAHPSQLVQRGHAYAIVDEVDSILIDEARTPLIISGPSEDSPEPYIKANRVASQLRKDKHFEMDEKERNIALTEEGIARCEQVLQVKELFTELHQSEMGHRIVQALKAQHLFQRDVHYVVKDGEVVIVDEFTGRLMEGRRFSDGLHQAIEAKEKVQVGKENQTYATVTLQNYFRMYRKLAGMTGTAATEEEEFTEIYNLPVVIIPTNMPMIREDHADVIFRTKREKFQSVADEVAEAHGRGQPVLVGTTSIETSELISKLLKARRIPHEVLNAKYHEKEAAIVAQAGREGAVTVATNMAGRGTDIVLGGSPEALADEEAARKGLDPEGDDYRALLDEKRRLSAEEKERVIAAGGLHIVGTERHESRRIDNQLRGRSGRQGDPGSSRFYLALEDDLLRLFGSERIDGIMSKLGLEDGEAIEHSMLSRAIENAQKKVEQMHFDIRRQLLMYDNVLSQQREAIYTERRRVLLEEGVTDRAWEVVEDAVNGILEDAYPEEGEAEPHSAQVRLKSIFWPGLEKHLDGVDSAKLLPPAREAIFDELRRRFDGRIAEMGEVMAEEVARAVILHVMDARWKEHLLAMDELRRGIGLRAIGQKDPLLEYQFESYNLFQEMLTKVREGVSEMLFRVNVVSESEEEHPGPQLNEGREMALPGKQEKQGAKQEQSRPQQQVRKGPKVGRNDPCPCGSGKKYKHCCGKVK